MTAEHALPLLRQQFRVMSVDGLGLGGHEAAAVAAGGLVHYLRQTKQGALEHVEAVRFYERSGCLELDAVSVRNLELVDPLFSGETAQTTLLYTMDACATPMGKRLLRATLLRPAMELAEIRRTTGRGGRSDCRPARARTGATGYGRSARPGTTAGTGGNGECRGRGRCSRWLERWEHCQGCGRRCGRLGQRSGGALGTEGFDVLEDLHALIVSTIADEPPVTFADGGVVRAGIHPELDELRELARNGRAALVAIEERERARTGIGSLKVRYNSVFGYYLEVTKANSKAVPADYERKQTLVNAERFTTPELKDLEAKILTAQERSLEIERRLFAEMRAQLLGAAGRMRDAARRVAEIDLLACFAHLAALRGWVRPLVEDGCVLEFIGGRHPVVERRMEESGTGRFIPNNLYLDASAGPAVLLMTGPNMGGKSTYLRMAALLVVMAQCGCFVPAESMRCGAGGSYFHAHWGK